MGHVALSIQTRLLISGCVAAVMLATLLWWLGQPGPNYSTRPFLREPTAHKGWTMVRLAVRALPDGTATNALAYTGATKALSFKAGETNKSFTVKIINDFLAETNETFTVMFSSPNGEGQLGTNSVNTVTITDDDGGGDVPDQHILMITYLGDGSRLLTVAGDIRGRVTIEGSNDFVQWTSLTQLNLSPGSAEWIDTDTSADASTCYRIWVMPND
jgi:hypothetical protein